MNSRRWQDHFPEAAKASEDSFANAGSSSALFYALDQKLMAEKDYFSWAQDAFELPILRMSFFSDHQADPTVWQKWKKHYDWQSDCLPLSEWDGILYVACLEPRAFPENIKAVCLLTPPAGLKQMWMNYESQTAFELQDSGTAGDAPASEAEVFEPPSGMATAAQSTPAVASHNSPLVNLDPFESLAKEVSAPLELDLNVLELDPILDPLALEANPKTEPAVASAVQTSEAKPETKPEVKPAPAARMASVPQRATPQLVSTSIYYLDTVLKKDNSPLNANQIFEQMKTHFEKSLILAVDTLEKSAKTLLWDDHFQAPPALAEIALTEASLFRIATTTQRPYHGMVVQNTVNDQFFADWNESKIPDHVTVVPIIVQDHVVGLLMGFGSAEAFNRNVLQFTEKLAADLSQKIDKPAQAA